VFRGREMVGGERWNLRDEVVAIEILVNVETLVYFEVAFVGIWLRTVLAVPNCTNDA
jgi:hypothetical protein